MSVTVLLNQNNKKELFDTISNCKKCKNRYGKEPFHFPIREQKVVLISACPSIQAMHRPLTSIRFFRQACTVLFGEKGISFEAIDAFHNLIYWTHLHKCCYYEAWKSGSYSNLPMECQDSFIEKEIQLLNPKIIIGVGAPVAEALFEKELVALGHSDFSILKNKCLKIKKWDADVFLTGFPNSGTESRFDSIRSVLANTEGFSFMNQKDDKWFSDGVDYSYSNLKGLRVNIDFEMKALVNVLSENNFEESKKVNVNDIWLKKIVLPNMKNYEKATHIIFYIEDIIRTMMEDIFANKIFWRCSEYLREKELIEKKPIDYTIVYEYLQHNWHNAFKDYFKYQCKQHYFYTGADDKEIRGKDIENIYYKIKYLKFIRNKIAHNSGYLLPSEIKKQNSYFNGIVHYVNMLVIRDKGIEELMEFAKELIAFIKDVDRSRVL